VGSDLTPAHYRAMFEAAPVALLVFDADLTMVHANPRYLDAVGLRLDDIAGRYVFDVFPDPPDQHGRSQSEALRQVMRAAVERREPQVLADYPYEIPLPDGGFDRRLWNVTEVPVLGEDGAVELVLHYTEDVTELVRAREAREEAARLAETLNARLAEAGARDHSVASVLQDALLAELPDPSAVRLRAAYRPAAHEVGGDWYDAVELASGATSVMIGDVVGHDIEAAAAMGQLRSMLRVLAWSDPSTPARVLTRLEEAMTDLDVDVLATAVLATVDAADGSGELGVTYANAGHPPPLLVPGDGEVRLLDSPSPDTLLGVGDARPRHDATTVLEPGDQLLLYTDGLVETRGSSIDDGLDRLVDLAGRHRRDPARVERIIADMTGDHHEDDIAVIVVENPEPAR
jgi:PAS domain S-box-containing protein